MCVENPCTCTPECVTVQPGESRGCSAQALARLHLRRRRRRTAGRHAGCSCTSATVSPVCAGKYTYASGCEARCLGAKPTRQGACAPKKRECCERCPV